MGKSSPAPIDYQGAAIAEGEAAKQLTAQQTWANRPTQTNPWGVVDYTQQKVTDPGTGEPVTHWGQQLTLNPYLDSALQYQMQLQNTRSELGAGMMEGLSSSYFDQNGNYRPPDWSQFPGAMRPADQQQMHMQATPDLWAHLQWDLPEYATTGTVRQLDFGNLPGVDAPEWTQQRAENSIYQRGMSRLAPQQQAEKQALEIKLRNQGLVPGDEGWNSAQRNLNQKHTDALQALENETIMGGGREAERMFGMQSARRGMFGNELMDLGNFANTASGQEFMQNMTAGQQGFQDVMNAAQFQNAARNQAYDERMGMFGFNQNLAYREADYYNQLRQAQMNEYLAQRGFTLNEIQALLNNQQVGMPQFNEFSNATKADTPQLLQGAMLQGQQAAADSSAENMFMNNLLGGAASIAGMSGMFSDRRLKSNIRKIGERNGVNWYRYDIFGTPQIGVMADEVPWAAFEHPSGFLMVDYRRV
jgi:hypothetical protein